MNEPFMGKDIQEASSKVGGDWLKGADFDGAGLVLKVAKPMEKIKSQYGAEEKDWLVSSEILAVGESFRYTFEDAEGKERKIDSSSTPFFIGFKQCEELGVGDWVSIVRTGKTDKTRYTVEKVDAPSVSPRNEKTSTEVSSADVNDQDIPF